MPNPTKPHALATRVIHAGQTPDPTTGAIMPPIYATSTYVQSAPGEHQGFEYSRSQNPTRMAFERSIADLETGTAGFAFASGMAAIATTLELLKPGDHVIVSDDVYGGTFRLFEQVRRRTAGLEFSFVDMSCPLNLQAACKDNTTMLWAESPSNPMLKLIDLAAVAQFAKERHLIAVMDNTFATPILQQPLSHGFDLVIHSATKYLSGHSDVVSGIVVTNHAQLAEQLGYLQNAIGAIAGPFDSFLALRGVKTLALRMARHCDNALTLANWLEAQPQVTQVYYPGLTSHPQHSLAQRQMNGFGGMIGVRLAGDLAATKKMLTACQLFSLAESLGGVESLIEHPAIMTHATVPAATRAELGLTDNFIRLSVGIEAVDDLQQDLAQALALL